jgi:hypothetical protein
MKPFFITAAMLILCACMLTPQPVPPLEDAASDAAPDAMHEVIADFADVVPPDAAGDGQEAADVPVDPLPEEVSGDPLEDDAGADVIENEPGDAVEIEEDIDVEEVEEEGDVEEDEGEEEEPGNDIEEVEEEEGTLVE